MDERGHASCRSRIRPTRPSISPGRDGRSDTSSAACAARRRRSTGPSTARTAVGHAAFQNSPPGIGVGTPVVVGRLSGRPRSERTREIAEALRLDEVAVPADRLDRIDRHAEPLAPSLRMKWPLSRPPPVTSQRSGRRGTWRSASAAEADREGGQGRRAVGVAQPSHGRGPGVEVVAVERFRRRPRRSRDGFISRATSAASARARGRERAVLVVAAAPRRFSTKSSSSARGRAGVEGDHRVAVDIGDVADAAEVEHHHAAGAGCSPARGGRAARRARPRRRRPRRHGGSG